ncbi:MAG: hypothetical protein ACI86X_000542 [Moritella sp.]|jgi:hypothetical protein
MAKENNGTKSKSVLRIQDKLKNINSIELFLQLFEIDFDNSFIEKHRAELLKHFSGCIVLTKPQGWFDYRRCLKNAYCRVQRNNLDRSSNSRSACRGCTSCERR